MIPPPAFRIALLSWYETARRDLPWRESTDFYRVWISEIMLQQTRVEVVIPYYYRFLDRFPDIASLAAAPEEAVLAAWSGLGYYSRARNLQRAAQQVVAVGLPSTYEQVLALPGAGPYTAAAIASIALDLPHAAVDGNVLRVISRLTNDASEISSPVARRAFHEQAQRLLDAVRPGDFNQAMMELGATVCVPSTPRCGDCPVADFCEARASGTQRLLPIRVTKPKAREVPLHVLLIEREGQIFLRQRKQEEARLADFWELPQKGTIKGVRCRMAGEFFHHIVNDRFRVKVWRAAAINKVAEGRWFSQDEAKTLPLTTIARKALRAANLFPLLHGNGPKR